MEGFILVTEVGSNAQILVAADQIRYIIALSHDQSELESRSQTVKARIGLKPDAAQTIDVTSSLHEIIELLRKLGVRISTVR